MLAQDTCGRMMDRMRNRNAVQRSLLAGAAATLSLLSGCQTTPTAKAPPPPPAPTLQLLEAKPLVVADDCIASGSYFVGFTVQRDGSAAHIAAPSAPACVQQALTAWVSSFRYAPPPVETPFGVEWMLVTARRGS
jgi:hypothetical protein